MKLTVIGCSDAFGTGARLQTCYHVDAWGISFLIDCGATSLIGLEREGIDPNGVSVIFISHLHGDHFAGLVWWLIHANHISRRQAPLTIVGPEGTEERYRAATEILFPGTASIDFGFDLTFLTLRNKSPMTVEGIQVTPFEVNHPSGAPPYALRIEVEGKTIAFSGDTEWVEDLIPAAHGADLFIAECFGFDEVARYHMNWRSISQNLDRLAANRVMLTHMGAEMLANRHAINDKRVVLAEDGLKLEI